MYMDSDTRESEARGGGPTLLLATRVAHPLPNKDLNSLSLSLSLATVQLLASRVCARVAGVWVEGENAEE